MRMGKLWVLLKKGVVMSFALFLFNIVSALFMAMLTIMAAAEDASTKVAALVLMLIYLVMVAIVTGVLVEWVDKWRQVN